jgi:hypothetical protein
MSDSTKDSTHRQYFPLNPKGGHYFGVYYDLHEKTDGSKDYEVKGSLDKNNDIFQFDLSQAAVSYDPTKIVVDYIQPGDKHHHKGIENKDYYIDGIGTLNTGKETLKELMPGAYKMLEELHKSKNGGKSFYGDHIPVDEFKMTFLHVGVYHITFAKGAFTTFGGGKQSGETFTLAIKVKALDKHATNHEFKDGLIHIYKNFQDPSDDLKESKKAEKTLVFEDSSDFNGHVEEKEGKFSDKPSGDASFSGLENDGVEGIGLSSSPAEADYSL